MLLRLRGGGGPPEMQTERSELGIAAGGRIEQTIVMDIGRSESWETNDIISFNVQLLNAQDFSQVTGLPNPPEPMDVEEYASKGGNFYKLNETKSDIYGDFEQVHSVGQLTGTVDKITEVNSILIDPSVVSCDHEEFWDRMFANHPPIPTPLEDFLKSNRTLGDPCAILCKKTEGEVFVTLRDLQRMMFKTRL